MSERNETLWDIIGWLTDIWIDLYLTFRNVSIMSADIAFVGVYLEGFFLDIAHYFFEWDSNLTPPIVQSTLYARTIKLGEWLEGVSNAVDTIFNWDTIKANILDQWADLESTLTWWADRVSNITGLIDTWWGTTTTTVQGWIDTAVEGLSDLKAAWDGFWTVTWPEWTGSLTDLQASWKIFIFEIYPTLADNTYIDTWWNERIADISLLIGYTIKSWFPFYDELAELWDEIETMFTDPEDYLRTKIESMLIRFW